MHNWTLLFMDETKRTTFTASLRSWWFCLSSAQMSGQAARRLSVRSFFPLSLNIMRNAMPGYFSTLRSLRCKSDRSNHF